MKLTLYLEHYFIRFSSSMAFQEVSVLIGKIRNKQKMFNKFLETLKAKIKTIFILKSCQQLGSSNHFFFLKVLPLEYDNKNGLYHPNKNFVDKIAFLISLAIVTFYAVFFTTLIFYKYKVGGRSLEAENGIFDIHVFLMISSLTFFSYLVNLILQKGRLAEICWLINTSNYLENDFVIRTGNYKIK